MKKIILKIIGILVFSLAANSVLAHTDKSETFYSFKNMTNGKLYVTADNIQKTLLPSFSTSPRLQNTDNDDAVADDKVSIWDSVTGNLVCTIVANFDDNDFADSQKLYTLLDFNITPNEAIMDDYQSNKIVITNNSPNLHCSIGNISAMGSRGEEFGFYYTSMVIGTVIFIQQ